MNEFDVVTIKAMKARIEVLEKSAEELIKQGRSSEAQVYYLKIEKLQEKITDMEVAEYESTPIIPECPDCHKDLGSNQEDCKTCFESIPENDMYCWACGDRKGSNDDCADCWEYSRDMYNEDMIDKERGM